MAIRDYAQVGAILHRLGSALGRLGPAALVRTLGTVLATVSDPPGGDPEKLADLAAAFRRAAADTDPVAADAAELARGRLPAAWTGSAFASAAETTIATAHLVGSVRPAFDAAADALTGYAATSAELRAEHRELRSRLAAAWHDATHVELFGRSVRALDVRALDELATTARELISGFGEIYRRGLTAADTLIARLGDVTARARASAVDAHPADAVTLAAVDARPANPGATDPGAPGSSPADPGAPGSSPADAGAPGSSGAGGPAVGGGAGWPTDLGVLPPWQLLRANRRRAALTAIERAAFEHTLAAAASPLERAYLWKALAAGHDIATVTAFAEQIRGHNPTWLREHLSVLDPARRGPVTFAGQPFAQTDGTTCGTTSIVVARALADPVYTLEITKDPESFREEQRRLHGRTNPIWPEALGTSPWGMERGLAAETGTRYAFHWTDDTNPRELSAATRNILTAVDAGHPVPLLVGNTYPAHYLLAVAHDTDTLLVYNPAGGRLIEVPTDDIRQATVFHHLQGYLTPR
ncbi:hypothetical protein [Cryptosporangium japonicum]|uniref:Uncharacterized protein n=1 Tax=Cryptosporangium japonicum TaxID=80872 RepID=A0ABN0V552_9ACTN